MLNYCEETFFIIFLSFRSFHENISCILFPLEGWPTSRRCATAPAARKTLSPASRRRRLVSEIFLATFHGTVACWVLAPPLGRSMGKTFTTSQTWPMLPTGSQRYILLYCGGCVSYHRRAKIGLKSDDSSSNGELPHAQLYYTCKWFTLAIAFFTFYTTILHSFLCKNDIKNQRIIKHRHRRWNVTSHHFFTLLSQFLFLWLFLHLTGATPFHRKEWS